MATVNDLRQRILTRIKAHRRLFKKYLTKVKQFKDYATLSVHEFVTNWEWDLRNKKLK